MFSIINKTDGVGCSILFKSKKKLNIEESKKSKSIYLFSSTRINQIKKKE